MSNKGLNVAPYTEALPHEIELPLQGIPDAADLERRTQTRAGRANTRNERLVQSWPLQDLSEPDVRTQRDEYKVGTQINPWKGKVTLQ